MDKGSLALNEQWIYNSPLHSDLEGKLRQLLIELRDDNQILGIQVCAYKDGEVIIDSAAGVLGEDDPRPVQPDSLFPVFSVTKGITAGLLHWLVEKGKLKLDEQVANIWPEFGTNGKEHIKVHHVLNHTSGLHNALANFMGESGVLMCDWDECLNQIAMSVPETEPGREQLYHYLSFGWLCGGIIEHASGKKFQEILEEAIIQPLQLEGELYVGIPQGVESRLATVKLDKGEISWLSNLDSLPAGLPSTFQPEVMISLPDLFNMLDIRRAVIPAANGNFSARAIARFYASLVDGGVVPPPHSSLSKPLLGSHIHIPVVTSEENSTGQKQDKDVTSAFNSEVDDNKLNSLARGTDSGKDNAIRIFNDPKVHDSFLGVGEYKDMVMKNGQFGLGFKRWNSNDGSLVGFGHTGFGGSTGFCHISSRFAVAVSVNKLSLSGAVTRKIIEFLLSELNIPLPEEFSVNNKK